MNKPLLASSLAIFLCGAANSVCASEIYGAQNVPGGRLDLFLRGFVDQNMYGVQGAAQDNAVAQFDWAASGASFQSFNFVFSGGNYMLSRTYTTGPGQTETITASVQVDPFTVAASDLPQYQFTPGMNGLYNVTTVHNGRFDALPLSGRVVITGPTQTATVPFSVLIPSDVNIPFPTLFNVDTADYPSTLSLDFFHSPYYGGGVQLGYWFVSNVSQPLTLADATVDGVDVLISTAGGYASTSSDFDIHPVPESSTSLLLLLGIGGVIATRRPRN
jgi:hypothetical protein